MVRTVENKLFKKSLGNYLPESRPDDGFGAISDDATVFLDVGFVKIDKSETGTA